MSNTIRFHLLPTRTALIKKMALPSDGKSVQEFEPLPADGNVKWFGFCGKEVGRFSLVKQSHLRMSHPHTRCTHESRKHTLTAKLARECHSSIVHSQKTQATCLPTD